MLRKEVDGFEVYNAERPHYALHGFTPDEIYGGQPLIKNPHQQQIQEAVKKRIAIISKTIAEYVNKTGNLSFKKALLKTRSEVRK